MVHITGGLKAGCKLVEKKFLVLHFLYNEITHNKLLNGAGK